MASWRGTTGSRPAPAPWHIFADDCNSRRPPTGVSAMKWPRASGILAHVTSLPGPYGIGDFGSASTRMLDFLAERRQHLWQVLPLGPTGYGNSPYASGSAFAGNPLLISPERLIEDGLLATAEVEPQPAF